jgi:hypothetical protein
MDRSEQRGQVLRVSGTKNGATRNEKQQTAHCSLWCGCESTPNNTSRGTRTPENNEQSVKNVSSIGSRALFAVSSRTYTPITNAPPTPTAISADFPLDGRMSGIVDVDADGHEDHVHTWWELVFDAQALERHLVALKSGRLHHPSGGSLVEVFLSNRKKQLEGGHRGNAEALLQCAVRVATELGWTLEEVEQHVPEAEWARTLLEEGRVGEASRWGARFRVRHWAGQAEERERVLACVAELKGVPEARDECCRALFVAGLTAEANAAAEKGSAWDLVTRPQALGFENVEAATWKRIEREHKRPREEPDEQSESALVFDELAMEQKARDAYARGDTAEAKQIAAQLHLLLKTAGRS